MSKENHDTTQPVFRLKPTPYSNSCIIKHVGYLTENEKLGDERAEFETPQDIQKTYGKNVDYLGNINKYNIKAYIFRNNVLGSYLLQNETIPVYSISITYEKNIVSGPLFDIFLGFRLDDAGRELIKTPNKIVNSTVYGTYELKILCDDRVKDNMKEYYNFFNEELLKKDEILSKIQKLSEEDFEKYLEEEINNNKTYISELINGKSLDIFETHTKTIENILRPLYRDSKLNNFIEFALNKREEERRDNYKAVQKYELPKRVLNIRDVEKDENYLKTYLGLN